MNWHPENGSLNCTLEVQLFSCISASLTLNSSSQRLYLLRAWTELWLPVNLTRPWSKSTGITQLYQLVTNLTHRTKRFVGMLITVVLGPTAITSTAAVVGVALQESLQTADFVQNWHYNSHLWQQHDTDIQLETDVQNLKQTVSWLGDQIRVLTTQSLLRCDWNSTQFCVTPTPYNTSSEWAKIKDLLWGHKTHPRKYENLKPK